MRIGPKIIMLLGIVLAVLCLSTVLQSCGGGGSSSSSGPPPAGPELLFVSTADTLYSGTVSGATSTQLGSATIPGLPGTYTRSGTLVTVTMPNHELLNGYWVDLVFAPGTGGTATSGLYQATKIDADTFTIDDSASGTITGGTLLRKFTTTLTGTYSQVGTAITVTCTAHALSVDDTVQLHFTSGTAVDETVYINTVPDADTFTVTAADTDTTSGNVEVIIGSNYTIFQIAMHPSGKWVYTTSTYECWNGAPFCWDGALISRFAVNWSTGALSFQAAIYAGGADSSAPVGLNFSADGTRLFVQDDWLDGIRMYSVNSTTGDLTLLDSLSGTYLHGVGVSADGTRIYNGDNVFSATSTSLGYVFGNIGGCNSSIISGSTLYCADDNGAGWEIRTYSLADPDAPSEITSAPTNTQEGREIAIFAGGTRIVSSGWDGLLSFDYDGSNITPAAAAGSNEFAPDGWLPDGSTRKMFRNLSINRAGNIIATTYFTMNSSTSPQGIPSSGFMLVNLAADGSLSLAADYPGALYARAAKFFTKP